MTNPPTTGLRILREETFDLPAGKESFYEWQTGGGDSVTKKVLLHYFRIDADGTYTTHTDLKVHTYTPGAAADAVPLSTTAQAISVFAIKGEVSGSVRHDRMTMTIVDGSGNSTRQTMTVPVRLDLADFNNLDLAGAMAKMGDLFPAGISCSIPTRDAAQNHPGSSSVPEME